MRMNVLSVALAMVQGVYAWCTFQMKVLQALSLCVLCFSMTTVSELVDQGDIPEERKDNVKKVLHDLGYAPNRAVGKAFLKISEKHMTDAGMSIADANAIVEPLQGSLLLLNHHFSSAQ